jgi:hypothetical protein
VAVQRLPMQVQRIVEMRCDNVPVDEIARQLNLSPKTLWNSYSFSQLTHLIKNEVRALVLELPSRDVGRVVAHLYDDDLSREQVGRLLCLPRWVLESLEGEEPVSQQEALLLLGGDLTVGWVA